MSRLIMANSIKLQTTLTGFDAWALAKLADRLGKTQAEVASHIIWRFFDENDAYLTKHGITHDQFEGEGKVVRINRSKDG